MKKGASITIANSFESNYTKRGTTKFKETKELRKIKEGVLIAMANNYNSV
jgi:hypothetical protein